MLQQTFTDMEYANHKRTMWSEVFLGAMEGKNGLHSLWSFYAWEEYGRKLIPLEMMLCIYLM